MECNLNEFVTLNWAVNIHDYQINSVSPHYETIKQNKQKHDGKLFQST